MRRQKPQFGIGSMMLFMLVCSVISAGFFYASRVEAIQQELNGITNGATSTTTSTDGRIPHVIFIMFTLTSPLILAGTLASVMSMIRWKQRTNRHD
ncbi:MAG: hypothetical protein ACON4H_00980 [Rubripirellula sp.]|jgi:hypothetical protein